MYRDFHRQESEGHLSGAPHKYEPDEGAAVSLLQYMSKEELEDYLNDTDKLDSIIADLPQVKGMKRDRENSVVKNKSLAEYNLSLQPKFDSLKREVATAYEEVNNLKLSLGEDVAKLESCAGRQSHDTLLAIYQTESATSDEQSEELADQFCNGQLDVDTFITAYIPKRTGAYIHKTKVDKMTELFRNQEPVSGVPYASSSVPLSGGMKTTGYTTAGYSNNTAPYPSGSYGMPTPFCTR